VSQMQGPLGGRGEMWHDLSVDEARDRPDNAPVSREDFDTLCGVVELLLGVPGGVLDQIGSLRWDGRAALDRFGEMRRRMAMEMAS